jgi:5,10-methylenetetrahydrofolate reductase
MNICDIAKKKFVVTSEIGPPKGTDLEIVYEEARLIKGKVDAVNVTDLPSSVMRLGSLAVSYLLKKEGLEPIYQITCRDRNRLALQSDILSAYVLGIRNILALTGDHPSLGDHPQAKSVFDLDSIQLINAIKTLETSRDLSGNEIKGAPKFCKGAVVNPGAEPLELEILRMEKKIKAGAEFFQTQITFDIEEFKRFRELTARLKVPVFAGIALLKSKRMADYLNENIAGVKVPDKYVSEIDSAPKGDRHKKSAEIAAGLIKELKSHCDGVHIMPIGWGRYVRDVIEKAGL